MFKKSAELKLNSWFNAIPVKTPADTFSLVEIDKLILKHTWKGTGQNQHRQSWRRGTWLNHVHCQTSRRSFPPVATKTVQCRCRKKQWNTAQIQKQTCTWAVTPLDKVLPSLVGKEGLLHVSQVPEYISEGAGALIPVMYCVYICNRGEQIWLYIRSVSFTLTSVFCCFCFHLLMLPIAWNIQESPFSRLWPLRV